MPDDGTANPMRAAQANMRPAPIKRFYTLAEVKEMDGCYALTLDGRAARTPGRNLLAAASHPLMLRVAEEWARQGETLDPADMPLTRLLNSAIDGVAKTMDETRADVARYAGSDLLCYRADEPEALAERQRAAFDPVLDWAAETFGGRRFDLAAGVMHVAQPAETLEAFRKAVEPFDDPAALAALSVVTSLTGSAILALAVARGRLTAEEAWRLAHLDEDFQAERWGADEEAAARREGALARDGGGGDRAPGDANELTSGPEPAPRFVFGIQLAELAEPGSQRRHRSTFVRYIGSRASSSARRRLGEAARACSRARPRTPAQSSRLERRMRKGVCGVRPQSVGGTEAKKRIAKASL